MVPRDGAHAGGPGRAQAGGQGRVGGRAARWGARAAGVGSATRPVRRAPRIPAPPGVGGGDRPAWPRRRLRRWRSRNPRPPGRSRPPAPRRRGPPPRRRPPPNEAHPLAQPQLPGQPLQRRAVRPRPARDTARTARAAGSASARNSRSTRLAASSRDSDRMSVAVGAGVPARRAQRQIERRGGQAIEARQPVGHVARDGGSGPRDSAQRRCGPGRAASGERPHPRRCRSGRSAACRTNHRPGGLVDRAMSPCAGGAPRRRGT